MAQLELKRYNEESPADSTFLVNVFNSEDSQLFWSAKRSVYANAASVIQQLNQQLGAYHIYIGFLNYRPLAVFIAHSISVGNRRCEILAYIDPSVRTKVSTLLWWTMLLTELHRQHILRVFAKIFATNLPSKAAAVSNGFTLCGIFPEYIYTESGPIDVEIYTRETKLSQLESYWWSKVANVDN